MIDFYVDFCSVLGSIWPDFSHVFRGVRGQIGFIPPLGAQLSLEKILKTAVETSETDFVSI